MFSGKTRLCYENCLLQAENLPLPNFFKICASFMDTRSSPGIPYMPHPMYSWISKDSKRESGSSKASWVLDWNLAVLLFHCSPEQNSHRPAQIWGDASHREGWEIGAIFASVSITVALNPELGVQHPGSPGEKANETSCPQRGKDKQGESIELVFEFPGSQGKNGYLMKHTAPTSRERAFPPGTEFSQRTFVLSANIDALSG